MFILLTIMYLAAITQCKLIPFKVDFTVKAHFFISNWERHKTNLKRGCKMLLLLGDQVQEILEGNLTTVRLYLSPLFDLGGEARGGREVTFDLSWGPQYLHIQLFGTRLRTDCAHLLPRPGHLPTFLLHPVSQSVLHALKHGSRVHLPHTTIASTGV